MTFHGVLKYEYWDDLLVIRKFDINIIDEENIPKDELYVIYPPHRESNECEKSFLENNLKWPTLEGRFNVFYIYLARSDEVLSLVQYTGGNAPCIQYILDQQHFEFKFSSELLDRIHRRVK